MEDRRAAQLARNEVLFREVNERIDEIAGDLDSRDHEFEFLCECADQTCTARVVLTRDEYQAIRADPRTFILAPGHQIAAIEQVIDREEQYVIVRKTGVAGRVAEELDPRD